MTEEINQQGLDGKKRLYEQIVSRIQGMVRSGELKPGDRLPSERDMAQRFRVSRNSVREAIRALSENGVVESRRGDGTYLCTTDISIMVDSFARAIQTQKERLRDIFDFRHLVEPHIAQLAARHIKDIELIQLKAIVCDQERKILAGEDGADLDMAFHMMLARISGNHIMHDVLRALHTMLMESRSEFLQTESRKQSSVISHLDLIDALEKRNPDAARKAMEKHLNSVEQAVFDDEN